MNITTNAQVDSYIASASTSFTGSGVLRRLSSSLVTIGGSTLGDLSSFTGTVKIGKDVRLNAGSLSSGNYNTEVENEGQFYITSNTTCTRSVTLNGSGWNSSERFGALRFNTYSGSMSGNIILGSDSTIGVRQSDYVTEATISGQISGNHTLTVTSGNADSVHDGTREMDKSVLILTGNNSYGATNIDTNMVLQIGNGSASGTLGTGNVSIASAGQLTVRRTGSWSYGGTFSNSGSTRIDIFSSTLTLTGNSTGYTSVLDVKNGATLILGDGGTTGTVSANLYNYGTVQFNHGSSAEVTINANLHATSGAFQKLGTGKTILSGTNDTIGSFTVSEGTLQLGTTAGGGTFTGAASMNIASGAQTTAYIESANTTYTGTGTLLRASSSEVTVNGSTLGNLSGFTGTLKIGKDVRLAVNSLSAGNYNVVVENEGQFYLGSTASTHNVTINGRGWTSTERWGAIRFDASSGSMSGNVTLASDSTIGVRWGDNTGTGTISGTISGNHTLTVTGGGLASTLILAGNNSYGATNIAENMTLQIGNGSASGTLGTGNVTLAENSNLVFKRTGSCTVSSSIQGSTAGNGTLSLASGSGTVILAATNTYGDTVISGGTLQIGNGGTTGTLGTGSVTVNSNATLKFNRSDVVSFGGIISGDGALQQVGSGTTILTGINTYTGTTTVSAGTLVFSGNSSIGGTVNVSNDGTLQLGNGSINGAIGAASVALGASGTLKFQYLLSKTFTNAVSGTGTIVQNSGGTVNLSCDLSSFSGAVSVTKGTLNTTRAFDVAAINISNGTLKNSLVTLTAGNTTVSGGTLNLDGGSLVSDVTITGGTLKLNGGSVTGDVFLRGGNYSLKECTLNGDFIAYEGVALPILQSGVTINGTIYRGVDSVGSLSTNDAGGAFYFDEGTTLQLTMPSGSQAVEPEDLSLVSFSEMAPASSELISVTSLKQLSTGDVVTTDEAVVLSKLALHDGMTLDLTVNDRPTATADGWADLLTTTDGIVGDVSAFNTLNLNFGATSASFSGDLSDFLQIDGNSLQINTMRVLGEYNTAVPEPSTWLLLALGVFGLTAYTRRRRAARG